MADMESRAKLTFRHEALADVADEALLPLLKAHWYEVGEALCPGAEVVFNRTLFETMEQECRWAGYTARDAAGTLCGYAAFFVEQHPFMLEKYALLNVLYLEPKHRTGLEGIRFLRFCETCLRERDVAAIHFGAPAGGNDCSALFRRMGCRKIETMWRKEL